MSIEGFLNVYAYIAFTLFFLGTALKLGRFVRVAITNRKPRGRTPTALDAPEPMPTFEAIKKVLFGPITHFYLKANRTWARGYMFYHVAIITILSGYALSALILAVRILSGSPVPDVALGIPESYNYSPANLLAIVFGNAEHLQAPYLFGRLAGIFIAVTWVAVLFGLYGNTNLLITILRKKSGAVMDDLDPAARGIRTPGHFSWEHLFVTLLVFSIIWTEILARLELVPGIVYYHAALGLTIFAVFPFTYLFHIVYAFIAVYFAVQRRKNRTIA